MSVFTINQCLFQAQALTGSVPPPPKTVLQLCGFQVVPKEGEQMGHRCPDKTKTLDILAETGICESFKCIVKR